MRDTRTEWVCGNCIVLLANGDDSGVEPGEPAPLHLYGEGVEVTPGMGWEDHEEDCANRVAREWVDECGCEVRSFTWSDCDGCGALAGERHAVTVWEA